MSSLETWIRAVLNEDADKVSISTVNTLRFIKEEIQQLRKENIERKEECERLAKNAEFWQGKYYELNPGFQRPKIDNL